MNDKQRPEKSPRAAVIENFRALQWARKQPTMPLCLSRAFIDGRSAGQRRDYWNHFAVDAMLGLIAGVIVLLRGGAGQWAILAVFACIGLISMVRQIVLAITAGKVRLVVFAYEEFLTYRKLNLGRDATRFLAIPMRAEPLSDCPNSRLPKGLFLKWEEIERYESGMPKTYRDPQEAANALMRSFPIGNRPPSIQIKAINIDSMMINPSLDRALLDLDEVLAMGGAEIQPPSPPCADGDQDDELLEQLGLGQLSPKKKQDPEDPS